MSTQIVINGSTFNLPTSGDSPEWGTNLSDIIEALTNVVDNISNSGDILNTNFTPANNVSSPTNVTGLIFNSSVVRAAIISYSITRSTSSSELEEVGQMTITYSNQAGNWTLSGYKNGDAGITFSVTTAGQFQYTSTNMSGSNYAANLVFSAKSSLVFNNT